MIIRFLGTHSAESRNTRFVSFLIDEVLAVDAGSLASELTFPEQERIRAILLSHGHYDHIRGVPAFAFNNSTRITRVYASPSTLQILSTHLIDGVIYPKFDDSNHYSGSAVLELRPIEAFRPEDVEGYRVLAVPVNHPIETVGFEITSADGKSIFYTGDTGPGLSSLWTYVSPQLLITDTTFPNRLKDVAEDSGHLCPEMLKRELIEFNRIKGYTPRVILIHLNPQFESEIAGEVERVAGELECLIEIAAEGEELVL